MEWYFYLIIVLAVLIIISFVIGFFIWKAAIVTAKEETYLNKPTTDPIEVAIRDFVDKTKKELLDLNMEEVWIKSKDGLNLHGYYKKAPDKTGKTVISVHGWHGEALRISAIFSHFLVDYNYNVLFIDLRSYGQSEGKYTTYGVKDKEDLLEWIQYIKDRTREDCSIALMGISMGGNTVIEVADKVPAYVKCIIDDCGFTSAYDQFYHVLKYQMKVPFAKYFLFFSETINKIVNKWGYEKGSGEKAVKVSKVPILFIHGAKDDFVPLEFGKRLFSACTSEKELKIFENATHARSYFLNKEGYSTIVLEFLAKRL